ncbi:MAG: YybH family protein, partial [Methylobacter sp.]
MTNETAQTLDKAQIRQLISAQMNAICMKDKDRLISYYATASISFGLKPPPPTKNATDWEAGLPLSTEIRDLCTFVSGDMALAHWLWRFTGMEKDHPAMQAWISNIAGYQRHQGRWKVVYEYCSLR